MNAIRETLRGLEVLSGPFPDFDPGSAPRDPRDLFLEWLLFAIGSGVPEPHAMTLATVDPEGRPDARTLILKDVSDAGWHFAVLAASPKGAQIVANPRVALSFYWRPHGRQIRIRGTAIDQGPEAAAADFLARPEGARASALARRQSQPLRDPRDLDDALRAQRERLAADPGLVAPDWTLYAVRPDEVEFWQGDRARNHIRLRYRREGDGWARERLWP